MARNIMNNLEKEILKKIAEYLPFSHIEIEEEYEKIDSIDKIIMASIDAIKENKPLKYSIDKMLHNKEHPLWEEFRDTEEKLCCRIVQTMINNDMTHVGIVTSVGDDIRIRITHCPSCGKRII